MPMKTIISILLPTLVSAEVMQNVTIISQMLDV